MIDDKPETKEKLQKEANSAMQKVGALSSRKALVVSLALLVPVLYLRIPTYLTMGYYRFVLGKPLTRPRAPPRSTNQVIQEVVKEMEAKEQPEYGPLAEEEETLKCDQGLALLTGATGSVGRKATQLLLNQGFCVRIFTESIQQARDKLTGLEADDQYTVEFVEGLPGDIHKAFEPRESSGYASVTHVLFGGGNAVGVEECAAAAAQTGTVQSMVVMSAAWVSKPYSLASVLYNGMYNNLPSARHWQGEDALRMISEQHEQECDSNGNETSRVPLNYVILRSGRLVPDGDAPNSEERIGLTQDDSFDFWGPNAPSMSHSQLAQAAVAALRVEGKYTVEVSSGSTAPGEAFSMLLQDDEHSAFNFNQTVTMEDVEQVHAQAMHDFINVIFTLAVGTICLVALLGPGQGLFLSMTLYVITVVLWRTFLSNRTIWDCLASELPRKLPLLQVPGVSFGMDIRS